ncbi:Biopolymer transport protein ExbD/TolR [Posidoniimonas polymericola]|uniref:Biopolymer transport protein ExbD/TolR n=1 Tax=Posidoniimonas polymericola TaxID=2528002 RepID=A0A5C5YLZ6_9BACT|nr:biopolymer transporter ExbD [Posidoniimonas polymericola]TWT75860.1 Biopolymer transport protein ExbD/TolR [Posidoniimonas polymericola]
MSPATDNPPQEEIEDEAPGPPLRRRRKDSDDEMDITPMIDITFLLLIFFLVASTPDKQTAIELPDAKSGSPVSQLTSVVFTIGDGGLDTAPVYKADGKIEEFRLSDDPEKRKEEVKQAVEEGFAETKTDAVIKGDKSINCREVHNLIKAISQVEGMKIHLAILEVE